MAAFGVGVLVQVAFKVVHGLVPTAEVMGAVGVLALAATACCCSGGTGVTTSTCVRRGSARGTT